MSKKNYYLDLVKDGRVSEDDLKLLFEKDLEHASSTWIFAVGALVGILSYAVGTITALGVKALDFYQGQVSTVVAIATFIGITIYLYKVNWEKVSRDAFKYYVEAVDEVRRRRSVTSPA